MAFGKDKCYPNIAIFWIASFFFSSPTFLFVHYVPYSFSLWKRKTYKQFRRRCIMQNVINANGRCKPKLYFWYRNAIVRQRNAIRSHNYLFIFFCKPIEKRCRFAYIVHWYGLQCPDFGVTPLVVLQDKTVFNNLAPRWRVCDASSINRMTYTEKIDDLKIYIFEYYFYRSAR